MAKWHKNWPADAPGAIELEEEDVEPIMRHLEEQAAKGIPGVWPWPDDVPLEIVEDDAPAR